MLRNLDCWQDRHERPDLGSLDLRQADELFHQCVIRILRALAREKRLAVARTSRSVCLSNSVRWR